MSFLPQNGLNYPVAGAIRDTNVVEFLDGSFSLSSMLGPGRSFYLWCRRPSSFTSEPLPLSTCWQKQHRPWSLCFHTVYGTGRGRQ